MIARALSRGRITTPIALALIFSLISAVSAEAAVTIAWDPSPDETVIGYQVYVGTSSGSYTQTFDVGLATSFSYSPPDTSNYYFAIAAYAHDRLLGPLSREVSTGAKSGDANEAGNFWTSLWESVAQAEQALRARSGAVKRTRLAIQNSNASGDPKIEITVPTPRDSHATDQPFVTLGGKVIDDGVVTEVTWTTDRGYNGRATGTENWIAGVPLQRGTNIITVRARDIAGRVVSRAIVVKSTARAPSIIRRRSGR